MSLTDLLIKRLSPPASGQKTYFDDALPGFGIRVSQGGTKTFVVLRGKRRLRKSLGRYPDLSLARARILAKQEQAEFALKEGGETSSPTSSISFLDARELFLSDCEIRNKPKTVEEYRRLLQRHFKYRKNLTALTRSEISKTISSIKHAPSEQKHAYVALRTMMNWCRKRGYIDASPMPELTFKVSSRSRVLANEELGIVWRRAVEFGNPFGPIVQLLILTGQRRGEIANLRASWIDDASIKFPASFTKNGREHVMPLGERAMSLIENLPVQGDLFFPSRASLEQPYRGFSKAKVRFDAELTIEPYVLHDLRRTFSSVHAEIGTPIHVTERMLNHASGTVSGVAAIYNRHSYLPEMRAAQREYESRLNSLIGGSLQIVTK